MTTRMRPLFARVLLVSVALLGAGSAAWGTGVLLDTYSQVTSFNDALGGTTMTLAFDGTHYWSCSGGSSGGTRLAQYDATGALVATFAPGLDFRSVFTSGDAPPVYARAYGSATIYVQTSPGVFAPHLTLTGGFLDAQSSVVLDEAGAEYLAMNAGTVSRWDATTGAFLGTVTLSGWGSQFGEASYPQDRGIIARNGYYMTYSNQFLSAWTVGGTRAGTAQLIGAASTFDAHFSFSQANGLVWVCDNASAPWRAFGPQALPPDGTAPTIDFSVLRPTLWPASLGMLDVGVRLTVTDDRDPAPSVVIDVWSDEANGAAPYSPDATIVGTQVRCRAERAVPGDGRVYLIRVIATDASGNVSVACGTVVVPGNLTAAAMTLVRGQAAAAAAHCAANGTPPPGYVPLASSLPPPA